MKNGKNVLIIFFVLLITTFTCNKNKDDKAGKADRATILFPIGEVSIIDYNKQSRPAGIGEIITINDIIVTGEKSQLTVQLGSDVLIKINENSNVEFKNILDRNSTSMNLQTGSLIFKVKKLANNKGLKIKTPTAVASVRGTEFGVFYYNQVTKVAVKKGKVEVNTMGSPKIKKQNKVITENQTAVIMNKLETRQINIIETLTINKISSIDFVEPDNLDNKELLNQKGGKEQETDEKIDKKIKAVEKMPTSMTYNEIRKRYQRVDVVTLYSGKKIIGVIYSRGTVYTIITPRGIIKIPLKQIKQTQIQ